MSAFPQHHTDKKNVLITSSSNGFTNVWAACLSEYVSCQFYCLGTENMPGFSDASHYSHVPFSDKTPDTKGDLIKWILADGDLMENKFQLDDQQIHCLSSQGIDEIWHIDGAAQNGMKSKMHIDSNSEALSGNLLSLTHALNIPILNFFSFSTHPENPVDSTCSDSSGADGMGSSTFKERALIKAVRDQPIALRILRHPDIMVPMASGEEVQSLFLTDFIERLRWYINFIHDRSLGFFLRYPLKMHCPKGATYHWMYGRELVDYASHLTSADQVSCQEIYQLKPNQSVAIEAIVEQINALLPDIMLQVVSKEQELNPVDRLFNDKIRQCLSYLSFHKFSEKKQIETDGANEKGHPRSKILAGCISEAINQNNISMAGSDLQEERIFKTLEKKTFQCRLKGHITYYTIGQGEPVFFLQTLLDDIHIWKRILPGLSRHHKLILWQHRGLENPRDLGKGEDFYFGPLQRAHDIKEIMDHEGWDKINLISYCAGGIDAFYFHRMYNEHVSSMTFLSGPEYASQNDEYEYVSDYMRNEIRIAEMVNADNNIAPIILRTIRFNKQSEPDFFDNNPQAMDGIIGQVNPKYKHFFINGLNTEQKIIRYYQQFRQKSFGYLDFRRFVDPVAIPTFFIFGEYDRILYPEKIMKLVRRIEHSQWLQIGAATHWLPLENPTDIIAPIRNFISKVGK